LSPNTTSDIDPGYVGNDASGGLGDKLSQLAAIVERADALTCRRAAQRAEPQDRPLLIVSWFPILIVSNENGASAPELRPDRRGDWRALLYAWRRTREAK
jgi:hypothetical protein